MIKFFLTSLYGFAAGMVAALVLWAMGLTSSVIWSGPETAWYIFAVIMIGGILIAVLRYFDAGTDLSEQLDEARKLQPPNIRKSAILAVSAIIAVGFGGAIGPEAGILAVIGELSAIVSYLLARAHHDSRIIGEVGAAGALSGLYGSPPGAALLLDEDLRAPKWQLYLASLLGLAGFLIVARQILPENPLHVDLPAHVAAGNGSEILLAALPAILGAATGALFILTFNFIRGSLQRLGSVWVQTLIGTTIFAILAAMVPVLRFSGHHELHAMLEWGHESGMAALLVLAALKILALSLCLASGWRGGAIFPLIFAGAAAGGAVVWILPQIPVTVALVAGIGAATTVGMGKPIAAMLITLFLVGPVAMGPLCTGLLIGWLVSKKLPPSNLH